MPRRLTCSFRYRIDAVTLSVAPADSHKIYSAASLERIGNLIESTMRSLNNILEHLHQSFFFYLLPGRARYISIAYYTPSAVAFASCFVFKVGTCRKEKRRKSPDPVHSRS